VTARPVTTGELARIVGGALTGEPDALVTGASVDSRRVQPGHAFFALPGDRTDGHAFSAEALARSASCVVVTRPIDVAGTSILVPDALAAMRDLAVSILAEWRPVVIAVTGSVGKTSVKKMVTGILERQVATSAAAGNLNTEIGVPLAIANADPAATHLVLEFAMRGPGQIGYLAEMTRPVVAAITNIGVSHIELLGTREHIAGAKRELFEEMDPSGTACVNLDGGFPEFLMAGIRGRAITFSATRTADVSLREARDADAGTRLVMSVLGETCAAVLRAPGAHQVINALCAAAISAAAGMPVGAVGEGLEAFEPEEHRGRLLQAKMGFDVIDDCYNASPHSVEAAIEVLKSRPCRGRRIAVLGDMLELGDYAVDEHLAVGRSVADARIDRLITIGELAKLIARGAMEREMPPRSVAVCDSREEAEDALVDTVGAGDLVLVKASRGLALESLVGFLVSGEW